MWLLLPVVVLACRTTTGPAESTATAPRTPGAPITPGAPTTALPVTPVNELPAGFTLVTREMKDGARNFFSRFHVPRAVENEAFNAVVDAFVLQQVEAEQPDSGAAEPTSLEVWLIDFRANAELVQCLFRAQTYTQGAAHYNHGFLTLNYDVVDRKQVHFTDLIVFAEDRTPQGFCELVNRSEQGLEPDEAPQGGLTRQDLEKEPVFEVRDGKLVIYPNHCCAAEGKNHRIDSELIRTFLNPVIAKKFGL